MVLCPLCDENIINVETLRPHLRFFHNNPEGLQCKECHEYYQTVSSFIRHVPRHINNVPNVGNEIDLNNDIQPVNNQNDDLHSLHDSESDSEDGHSDVSVDNDHNTLHNFLDDLCSSVQFFSAQLYAHPNTSRKLVDHVLTCVGDLLCSPISVLKKCVFSLLGKCECNENNFADLCLEIEQMFKVLVNPLQLMETEHQRLKELEEMGCFIPPEAVEVGVVGNFEHMEQEEALLNKPLCVQIVPLRKSLKAFLEIPGMYEAITNHMLTLQQDVSGKMSNVLQGSRWREIKTRFEDRVVIPLNLDFDDLEPDNPLGSHHGDHKLGNLYAEIPCLPPEIRSRLDNILLVATFESKLRKEFGNEGVFRAVIQELQFLEEEGITIEVDGMVRRVYFCLLLIIGDNLGVNGILGFVEGFRANFFCRFCKLHRDETEHNCVAIDNSLRTVQNYEVDVGINDLSVTGVKEICIWNELTSYHCIEAGVVDLMHDVHEGLLKYGIANILYYTVHIRDYLSLQTLKDRIDGFNFGPSEKGNKPPSSRFSIDSLQSCSLNLSATEMVCLGLYLGEMIGDLVPKNNPVWKFYILLREILEIVLSPTVAPGVCDYLRVLVAEHHELYQRYFGHLKPKHHFLTHYPSAMERNGPLLPLSAFLSERNHRKGKMYAKSCMSRVNIALSVAIKYQLHYCERIIRKESVLNMRLSMTKVNRCPVYSLRHSASFVHLLEIDMNHVVNAPKTISVHGTLYSVGMVLFTGVDDFFPTFGKIVHIVHIHLNGVENITFVLQLMRTISYENHICGYEVQQSDNWMALLHSECIDHVPLWPRFSISDGKTIVSLRHNV